LNKLVIGNTGNTKTSIIKNWINLTTERVVILDFNNSYDDLEGANIVHLDKVNPIIGVVTLDEATSLNAGYLPSSICLTTQCQEILAENNIDRKEFLIEEAIERLQVSWGIATQAYGKILHQKVPIKKSKSHIPLSKIVDEIKQHRVTVLKTKNMHSDHLRAVVFMLLTRISHTFEQKTHIISDELTLLFNQGNTKLFLKTINPEQIEFVYCFNKFSSVSPEILKTIDEFHVHPTLSVADIKKLKETGINLKKEIKNDMNTYALYLQEYAM
jgi:hypothetical protein